MKEYSAVSHVFPLRNQIHFLPRSNCAPTQCFCRMLLIPTYQEIGPSHKRPWTTNNMRLRIGFVIALIATCIAAKDKEEGDFGLEEWVKRLGANTLGSCRQKFTELVKKLGYKYVHVHGSCYIMTLLLFIQFKSIHSP